MEKRKIVKEKIEQLQIGNNYENEIKRLRNDVAFMNLFKHRSFYKDGMAVPFYMDIPITGEVVFDCDRRIWQSAIFDMFIYNRRLDGKENAVDSFGFRWLTCTSCGEIKREDEMVYLDGNEGLCRDCSRRKI